MNKGETGKNALQDNRVKPRAQDRRACGVVALPRVVPALSDRQPNCGT